jgi:hypothetical protein
LSNRDLIRPSDATKECTVKSLLTGRIALKDKAVADHDYPSTARRVHFKDFPTTESKSTYPSTMEKPQEPHGGHVAQAANPPVIPPENSSVVHNQASGSAVPMSRDVSESTEVVATRTSDVSESTEVVSTRTSDPALSDADVTTVPVYRETYTRPLNSVGSYKENPWILVKGVKGKQTK